MDSLREEHGPVRSMSAKGCGPDNAAAEGFLGGPGSRFLHGRDWKGIGYEEFCRRLAACLTHCNETGVKKSLGWMSPRYGAAEASDRPHSHPKNIRTLLPRVFQHVKTGASGPFSLCGRLGRRPATRTPPVRTGLASDAILRKNFGITTVLAKNYGITEKNDEGNVNNEA